MAENSNPQNHEALHARLRRLTNFPPQSCSSRQDKTAERPSRLAEKILAGYLATDPEVKRRSYTSALVLLEESLRDLDALSPRRPHPKNRKILRQDLVALHHTLTRLISALEV